MNKQRDNKLIAANKKCLRGENMTNSEVITLRDFYLRLTTDLTIAGKEFGLAAMEARKRFCRLDDYATARGLATEIVETA